MSNKTGAESPGSFLFVKAQHCFLLHCYVMEQHEDLSRFAYSHIVTERTTVESHISGWLSLIIHMKQLRFYIELQCVSVSCRLHTAAFLLVVMDTDVGRCKQIF